MAAANTPQTYDAVLKEMWPQDTVYDEVFDDEPCLAMMPKDTNFYEKIRHIALFYGIGQGVSSKFEVAKSNKSASKSTEFAIETSVLYSLFSITRKLIKQSKNDRGSLIRALATESERAIKAAKIELATWLAGNGGGARAKGDGAWTVSSDTVVVSNEAEILTIEPDMFIEFASTDGTSGSVRVGRVQVDTVDIENLTFTTKESNVSAAVAGVVNTDYLFREGDFGDAMPGIGAFIWDGVAATPPDLYGMDRTKHIQRQAGLRSLAKSLPRETAMWATKDIAIFGGKATHYFLDPTDLMNLQIDLASAGVLQTVKEPAAPIGSYVFGIPFEGIAVLGAKGRVSTFSDYHFKQGAGYMLTMPEWKLCSMGDLVAFEDELGLGKMMREEGSDSYEGRVVSDPAAYTWAPAHHSRVAQ